MKNITACRNVSDVAGFGLQQVIVVVDIMKYRAKFMVFWASNEMGL